MTSTSIVKPLDRVTPPVAGEARRTREVLVAVVVAGTLGLLLVQPWEPIPFPMFDFGGWLTLLSSASSSAEGFRALVEEHAREGRVNPLSMAYIAVNWGLFETRAAGWQLLRAAVMLGVIGSAYVLFRTLGAKRTAGIVGAAFFVVTDSARSVWILPQAIEHVATLLVLIAALIATSYHAAPRPSRSAVSIAALLVLAIWVREPMVAAVPFVLLLALLHRGQGELSFPRVERRSVMLVSIVGTAIAAFNVIPVIAVRFLERSLGYASRFGVENISLANVRNVLSALLLPVTREPLFPANGLFVLAIGVAALGTGIAARRYRALALLAATLPLCAATIYVMWPSFPGNYALPYVPAIALVFAVAVSVLWDASLPRRALAIAASVAVIGYGALLTVNGRRQYAASRLLDVDMAAFIGDRPSARLLVAVNDPRVSGEFGKGLSLYAKAIVGRAPLQASDVGCAEATHAVAAATSGVVVLRPPNMCAHSSLGTPTASRTRTALVRDWKTLRPVPWEASAAFWEGASAQ